MRFDDYLNEISVNDVEVVTSGYEFAHGKKPKGEGNWVIGIDKKEVDLNSDKNGTDYVSFNGGYALVVTKAKRVAKARGVRRVYVQS